MGAGPGNWICKPRRWRCARPSSARAPPHWSQLLQFPAPAEEVRRIPCPSGHQAHYHPLHSKSVLIVLGPVEVSRPYYQCPDCHTGQFPVDVQLDIENKESSPGVQRMQSLVGQEEPFNHGRQQMKVLAGLEVTAKAV